MLAHESVEAALDFVIVELEPRAQEIRGLIDARSQHIPAAGARTQHRGRGDESTMGAKGFETSRQHVRDGMRYREDLCVAQLSEGLKALGAHSGFVAATAMLGASAGGR